LQFSLKKRILIITSLAMVTDLSEIMYANWREFVDYENKQASFDSQEFVEFLEAIGAIEKAGICDEKLIKDIRDGV